MRRVLQQHGIETQDIHDVLLGITFGVIFELAVFLMIFAGGI